MADVDIQNIEGTPQWRRLEAEKIRKFSNEVLSRDDIRSFRVGLAGSAPLSWFLDHAISTDPNTPQGFKWKDADFFVCGQYAQRSLSFAKFVQELIVNINKKGYRILETSYSIGGNYDTIGPRGADGPLLEIVEFNILDITTPLSFIQCPGFETVLEVVENFDLDICKVSYETLSGSFHLAESVCKHVLSGKMHLAFPIIDLINTRYLSRKGITNLERHQRRVEKYQGRGFTVANCFRCDVEIQNTLERSVAKLDYNMGSSDEDETSESENLEAN